MRKEHLQYLKCPITGERLSLKDEVIDSNGEIVEGILYSSKRNYQIVRGIPRFVFDEKGEVKRTVEGFGYQWGRTKEFSANYGMDDEYFRSYFHPLDPKYFKNKIVLDAGCGNGRLIEYILKFSPTLIVGIDYSNAVEIAYDRTKGRNNVLIIQGDITKMPLIDNMFDYIYSLGVIHHIYSPKLAISEILRVSKPKGHTHIWTYSKEGNKIYLIFFRVLKFLLKNVSRKFKWVFSFFLAILLYPYMRFSEIIKRYFNIKILPKQEYFAFLSRFGFKVLRLVIFDQLIPEIAYYPDKKELLKWLDFENCKIFHLDTRTKNSWRVGFEKI